MPADGPIAAARRPEVDPDSTAGDTADGTSACPRVLGAAQEVEHTASRRSQPRAWLRAVRWLIQARAHPKARATTAAVAADLADRMDYIDGLVLYDLQGTADRLQLDVSTVKRHVAVLRELGALAWVRHGTKRNLHLPGRPYTATATIYAAVIPTCYDAAVGHRVTGIGYRARVTGITDAGRAQAAAAGRPARKRRPKGRAPHSLGSTCNDRKAKVEGGRKATRSRETPSPSPRTTILGRVVTAAAYQRADHIARALRPRHPWLQRASIAQLSWVLLDKVLDGWDHDLLHQWVAQVAPAIRLGSGWLPSRPHAYLAAQVALDADLHQHEEQLHHDVAAAVVPNAAFVQSARACRLSQRDPAEYVDLPDLDGEVDLTPELIAEVRREAGEEFLRGSTVLVTAAVANLGRDFADRLYGTALVGRCLQLAYSRHLRVG